VFDEALVWTLAMAYRGGSSLSDWWNDFGGIAGLIVPHTEFEKLVQCEDLTKMQDELKLVVESSAIGKRAFLLQADMVASSHAATTINAELLKLLEAEGPISAEKVRSWREAIINKLGKEAHGGQKREVVVKFCNINLKISVSSWMQEHSGINDTMASTLLLCFCFATAAAAAAVLLSSV
jgi:hypothetical protein